MRLLKTAFALMLSGWLPLALADQKTDFGDYTVHYNAFPSSVLDADVAKQYDLTRSKAIGYVNISVLPSTGETDQPVGIESNVEGQMLNDIRQSRSLNFQRIKEGKAVYYMAPFQYQPGEMLEFKVTVRPLGQESTFPLRFTQEFFND